MKTLKNKGQAQLVLTIATTAIVLIVLVLVLGQLLTTATTAAGATTSAAGMAVGNISYYTWTGVTLVAIGLILVAGMGLIGMMLLRR